MPKENEAGRPERNPDDPRWVGWVSRALIWWAEHMIRTEITGQENLLEAADYVNRNRGGLLVTPNHNSYIDAEILKRVRDEIIAGKKFTALWANKFTGEDAGKYAGDGKEDPNKVSIAGKIGRETARISNIELINVPQEAKDFAVARNSITLIENTGKEVLGGNNVLAVFPEGTRSREGTLHKAKKALRVLFRDKEINTRTMILPIVATGTGEYLPPDSEKVNPLAKVSIIYGKPYMYSQAVEESVKYNLPIEDVLMWHVAQLLPSEKWGEYRDTFSAIGS